jgi:hypothetical protein
MNSKHDQNIENDLELSLKTLRNHSATRYSRHDELQDCVRNMRQLIATVNADPVLKSKYAKLMIKCSIEMFKLCERHKTSSVLSRRVH